jgi:hypothetical protein
LKGRCPEGTIPIRRTKEEDVLRASSVESYGRKKHLSIPQPKSAQPDLITQSGHQVLCFLHIPHWPMGPHHPYLYLIFPIYFNKSIYLENLQEKKIN